MIKSKNRKKYLSKDEMTQFFLFYDKELSILSRLLMSIGYILFIVQNFMFHMYYPFIIFNFILFPIPYISVVCIRYKKRIKIKELDNVIIEQFIKFFETPGEKRKKSFKHLIEVVEIAKKDYSRRRSKFIEFALSFAVFLGLYLIYLSFLLIQPSIFIYYSIFWYIYYYFGLIIQVCLFLIMLQIFQRQIKYLNIKESSEIFKTYIDSKLSNFDDEIINLISSPNDTFAPDIEKLIQNLHNWYEFYCSRFSLNEELNDLLIQFKEIIFDQDAERFYLDIFTEFKGKLKDAILTDVIQQKKDAQTIRQFYEVLDILDNYLTILNHYILTKKERILEAREKRKSWQAIIYIIFFPVSIFLSILAFVF